MRLATKDRIEAFRRALELGAGERKSECHHMDRWRNGLDSFPGGCCDLASDCLALYLTKSDPDLQPYIMIMNASNTFRDKYDSTVNGHAIVVLDEYYIDLTLDQFAEYDEWVPGERIESGGKLGTLIKHILSCSEPSDRAIRTRNITLDAFNLDGSDLFGWLKNTTDNLLLSKGWKLNESSESRSVLSLEIQKQYADYIPPKF